MKKALRILSVMLALVLACSLVASACAETSYELLKELLSNDQRSDNPFFVSKSYISYPLDDTSFCMLIYNSDDQCLLLGGMNYLNKGEGCGWDSIDFGTGLYEIYSLALAWDLLTDYVDNGTTLVLGVSYGDEFIWITDSASAQTFVESVESLLNQ